MTAVMTTGEYMQEARRLEQAQPATLRRARVGIVSTFTADFLQPYLMVESAHRGLLLNCNSDRTDSWSKSSAIPPARSCRRCRTSSWSLRAWKISRRP